MSQSGKQLKSTFGRKLFRSIHWVIILAVIVLLEIKRHENTGYFNWRSKIWGDPAGYYVYSPALFIYDFIGNEYWNGIKLAEQVTDENIGYEQKITGDYWLPRDYTINAVLSKYLKYRRRFITFAKIKINLE